jgi:hypothetical protein
MDTHTGRDVLSITVGLWLEPAVKYYFLFVA